jgi:dihydroxyacetone kinase
VPIDTPAVADAFRAVLAAVAEIGDARPGDKTLVDALAPFVETFAERAADGDGIPEAWAAAAAAAERGAAGTAELVARRGRSARLGERSRGVQDPGATSLALTVRSIGGILDRRGPADRIS